MENVMQTGLKREEKVDKVTQREEEHLEMVRWINYNKEYGFPFMIIRGNDWDYFWKSDNEDYEMDMVIADCNEFYNKFKEITGVHLLNISNFIKMSYIDEARNDIVLEVNIGDKQEKFVIGV